VGKYLRAGQATGDKTAMRIACWMHKTTDTHSEYVIFLAFAQQQWVHEHASVSRYTFVARLVLIVLSSAVQENYVFPIRYSQKMSSLGES